MQLLTTLAYQLPTLLATVAVACMLLWWAPPVAGRKLALAGALTMLGASLIHLVLGIVQTWTLRSGSDYTSMQSVIALLSAINLLFNLVWSAGLIMLGWGACKAMQASRTPAS